MTGDLLGVTLHIAAVRDVGSLSGGMVEKAPDVKGSSHVEALKTAARLGGPAGTSTKKKGIRRDRDTFKKSVSTEGIADRREKLQRRDGGHTGLDPNGS